MTRRSFSKPKTGYLDTEIDAYFSDEPDRLETDEATREAGAGPEEEGMSRMREEVRRLRAYVAYLTDEVNARATPAEQLSIRQDRPSSLPKAVSAVLGVVVIRRLKRAVFG